METLRGCVVDGRLENARYRQNQLYQLHTTLRENSEGIVNALTIDSKISPKDVGTEFYLAMDSVKRAYDALDFDESLRDEYSVTKGQDNTSRRVGLGIIAIRPEKHSRLYSILTPLAFAIASKNAVILEIGNSDLFIDKILGELLPKSLDRDLLVITSRLQPSDISEADLFIDAGSQSGPKSKGPGTSSGRAIAIVDRAANLPLAAKAIVDSKVAPNNQSPYAPALVILNEFIKDQFTRACLDYVETIPGAQSAVGDVDAKFQEVLSRAEKAKQVKITKSKSSNLSVIEIKDRSCDLIFTGVRGPHIIVLPTRSAVDMIQTQETQLEHISTYVFAPASSAKFLAERIASAATYINQIPAQLLVGPVSSPHSLHPRYNVDMFSVPRPQIIVPVSKLPSSAAALQEKAVIPLKPTGQRPGHAVGFFEQGVFIGLGTTVFVIIPMTTWFMLMAVKRSWALWH